MGNFDQGWEKARGDCKSARCKNFVVILRLSDRPARDLKNNIEDIPDKMNDHTADCIRYRLRHNTKPGVSFSHRCVI